MERTGTVYALLAAVVLVAASCAEPGTDTGAAAPADTPQVPSMVTGTTGAPGPGTAGTPGTPAAPDPDTISPAAPDTLRP